MDTNEPQGESNAGAPGLRIMAAPWDDAVVQAFREAVKAEAAYMRALGNDPIKSMARFGARERLTAAVLGAVAREVHAMGIPGASLHESGGWLVFDTPR